MKWENKKVLITGASGFIGSHLTEKLVNLGADVDCFVQYNFKNDWGFIESFEPSVKEKLKITPGDLKDYDSVRKALKDKEIVFHLGALIPIPYSYKNPRSFVQTNILGTFNVLQAALENNIKKLIHTSTSEVYGTAQNVPISENHLLQAQSPYSATKISADKLAESFYLSYGLPVVTIRPFNTYGPRQSARAVIPTIISQALTKGKVLIGNGKPTRDFTYVTDTAEAFVKSVESEESVGEVINLGTNTEISIDDLVIKIKELIGKDLEVETEEIRFRPKKSEVQRLCADNSKARRLLDWQPKVSLDEGLKKTIEWIRENINLFKSDIYNV